MNTSTHNSKTPIVITRNDYQKSNFRLSYRLSNFLNRVDLLLKNEIIVYNGIAPDIAKL